MRHCIFSFGLPNVRMYYIKLHIIPPSFLQIVIHPFSTVIFLLSTTNLYDSTLTLIFKLQLMMIKMKSANESTLRETHKQQTNNTNRLNKSKQVKEVKKKIQPVQPQLNSIASISSKRLHKPSRSTIEPNEHLHYNSPITLYPQNENMQANTFSFTHILQQNLKNKQSQQSVQASIPPPVTSFQLNEQKLVSIPLTGRNEQRKSAADEEQISKKRCLSKDKMPIQRDYSFPNKNSVDKSVSKSPLRTVNLNKINNTPKIKQYKKEKDEEKTFRNLLENKQNQIRLQCSQKIFKYIESTNVDGDASESKKDPINCEKSKSNLLSTGIINLSQRLDHEKNQFEPSKTSKGHIFNKSNVQSSQIKQFFEEDSIPFSEVYYQEQVKQLKQKIMRINYDLQALSKKNLIDSFQYLTTTANNPEINSSKNNEIIQKISTLKSFIIETVESIVSTAAKLSRQFIRDIDEFIINIETSGTTNVDWASIEQKMMQSDFIEAVRCQNSILMERISKLQSQTSKPSNNFQQTSHFQAHKTKIEDQLKVIKANISKLPVHILSNSSKKYANNRAYQIHFDCITDNLQKLRTAIIDENFLYQQLLN